jgi:hypothetical protein
VFRFAAGATQSQQPVYTTEPPHWSKHVFATKHSVTVHAPALPPPLPAVPLVFAPPEFAPPVVLAPPDVAPPAFAPPRLGPPALAPPAPVPPAPAPLAPAFALPPSLEELEQPTHLTKHAKPIKTLLLAENRNAGFMPRSVPRARVPSAMRIGPSHGLGDRDTVIFGGCCASLAATAVARSTRCVRGVRRAASHWRAGIGSVLEPRSTTRRTHGALVCDPLPEKTPSTKF